MADITITFPDASTKQYPSGTTALEIAQGISEGLARECVVAAVDGELYDLHRPITRDAKIELIKFDDERGKEVFWHTTSHILAQAIKRLYPDAKPTLGPPIGEGFYYDFDNLDIKEEDLERIEAEMLAIVKEDLASERVEYASKDEALAQFGDNPYKREIIEQSDEKLSAYKQGEFIDLCRGPHLPRTGMVKAVKILRIAGAYWRGDAKNAMLTRLYGISFADKKQLKKHLEWLEEAQKRDHRRIGREMELYTTVEEVGPGMIFWLPKGNIIKEALEDWAKETEKEWGYTRVTTPLLTKENLFHTSEHLPHYSESMYPPLVMEGENYYVKPMNCPFHHMVFKARTRSYRELPLRVAEYGWCHRYEQSGALFGMMRVRAMQMNDAHIYCTTEQAVKEFIDVIKLHEHYYQKLGIKEYKMVLALRDPESDKYHGDEEMWQEAEDLMRQAMEQSGVPYEVEIGGAAFYGPKIDFQITSAIGREFTASTNQIDLFMPGKFGLTYIGEDGSEHTPVVIHRAPLGTHERFVGFLIEHFGGRFPLWLAPEQVAVVPIGDDQMAAAQELHKELLAKGLRSVLEDPDESLNKRIRNYQVRRVPAVLIIGQKEVDSGTVALRTLDGKTEYGVKREEFIARATKANEERTLAFSGLDLEERE